MKFVLKSVFFIVFLSAVIWTFYYIYQKTYPPRTSPKTQYPEYADIVKKAIAVGSLVPRKEVDIKPRISGVVDEICVHPGDKVKNGDILAKIKIIPDMKSLRDAELRLSRSIISLDDTRKNFERNKTLFERKVISEMEFQQFQVSLKHAEEELDAAKDNLKIIREGIYGDSADTSNTIIRSTIDGMVLTVPITVGKSVTETNNFNEGTTIATVADMTRLIFNGKVDESDVGKLKEGMELLLSVGALENAKITATLEHISPKGIEDRGAMQFEIRAAVSASEGLFIRAGYSATAEIIIEKKENVLCIPESFLFFKDGKTFVEVETNIPDIFEEREITTGLSDGFKVEIRSGITQNDKVKAQEPLSRK